MSQGAKHAPNQHPLTPPVTLAFIGAAESPDHDM